MTHEEFGKLIGVHFTHASRLRNGKRLPSTATLTRIVEVFRARPGEALAMVQQGPAEFSRWLETLIERHQRRRAA